MKREMIRDAQTVDQVWEAAESWAARYDTVLEPSMSLFENARAVEDEARRIGKRAGRLDELCELLYLADMREGEVKPTRPGRRPEPKVYVKWEKTKASGSRIITSEHSCTFERKTEADRFIHQMIRASDDTEYIQILHYAINPEEF